MFLGSMMVGLIELDGSAGASFGLVGNQANQFPANSRSRGIAGDAIYPAIVADLGRLRDDLNDEFQRLQARLAA